MMVQNSILHMIEGKCSNVSLDTDFNIFNIIHAITFYLIFHGVNLAQFFNRACLHSLSYEYHIFR
jgi:hypothetical protein